MRVRGSGGLRHVGARFIAVVSERMEKRRNAGLTTPKQIRLLESKGFEHVGSWSFDSASRMIARISANGWRVPRDIDPKTYTPEN